MENTISNKELKQLVDESDVTLSTGIGTIEIHTDELTIEASTTFLSGEFTCMMWLGDSEDEIELTDTQLDYIYNLIQNEKENDVNTAFSFEDQQHANTLIYA